jgi:rhamnulokinase
MSASSPRTAVAVAAVDLGASSGRVALARISGGRGGGRVSLRVVHRFPNVPVPAGRVLHWDILRLHAEILAGLRAAGRSGELAAVGIDSWGVDYGLIDPAGGLLGNPVHYRDARTDGAMELLLDRIPAAELYQVTGIQQLPINTVCQLVSAAGTPQLAAAGTLLMIPDLLGYWLTGETGAEVTNASTTQLLDVRTRTWARPVIDRAALPGHLFPALRSPGQPVGPLLPQAARQAGLAAATPLIAVGSHDTASAVAAVPAGGPGFAFISCGTWSLVGMELTSPVLTQDSRLANFSNEAGVDGTIRYLRNAAGLWLLQESVRAWSQAGLRVSLRALLDQAAAMPPLAAVVDAGNAAFLAAGDMPARIARECRRTGQPPPAGPAETARCVLDSLALAHRRAVTEVQQLSGRHADVVHIVGGGSRNELLCQLTADACGLPVIAGPAEAAAIGNALIQARALGAAPSDLPGLRALVRGSQRLRRFIPAGDAPRWRAAQDRLTGT